MKSDRSAALLLMGAAIIGIVIANSPFGPAFLDFKHAYVGFESIGLSLSVEHWVSDLLLATFFLVAGLELKYELSSGVLSKPASALVPVLAGIGGVVVPALIYVAFNWGTDYLNGWPIPTATDIAFALGILAIFGRGLPKSARVFLLALAIFDDLVAILIIAVFFTSDVEALWLVAAAVIAALHILMEKYGKLPINYVRILTFILLWYTVYQSGVHATVAGVVLGLIIPSKKTHSLVAKIQPWTNTVSLPIYAFFAVAIALPVFDGAFSSVFVGIAVALPVGKVLGITALAILANRIAAKPDRLDLEPLDFLAISGLAGIGFTVSLLMTNLAFADTQYIVAEATLAVILGSLVSMAFGGWLAQVRGRYHMRKHREEKAKAKKGS
jgi:NhaA family Na+:H+ antiporter|tara:strand:- start:1540 stop:2691 length:1152 start_codon:yes stop_codon:yes gene_type:complete